MTVSFYTVASGEQLYRIARNHYGAASFRKDREVIIGLIRGNNPWLTDIDKIRPGQVIMLPSMNTSGSCPVTIVANAATISRGILRKDDATKQCLKTINTEDAFDYVSSGASGFVDLVEKRMREAGPRIIDVTRQYSQLKGGKITKGQYDYRRRVSLASATKEMGVLRKLVYPDRKLNEVIRIKPHATNRAASILKEVDKIERITKVAKYGGVVLKVVDLGTTYLEYKAAETREERIGVLVDWAGETAGGAIGTVVGVGLATMVLATPFGWVGVAIAIGMSATGTYVGGRAAELVKEDLLFDENGERVDCTSDRQLRSLF
ncbi:colicin-like pore-forming protein [Bosea sp. 124]|uniref:colicin-like pore-forming protein n=1 Tax=Bosea sp. 124 TaxID=2135642 RepID=UPI000D47ABAF|nr:colicin-like pore-forming protein [Bosea sp. 124]PTM38964.1 hypothetical protein C8D03_0441 [Bosea sp. 124]